MRSVVALRFLVAVAVASVVSIAAAPIVSASVTVAAAPVASAPVARPRPFFIGAPPFWLATATGAVAATAIAAAGAVVVFMLALFLFVDGLADAHGLLELLALDGVLHVGFIGALLLPLDGEQGVLADLCGDVAGGERWRLRGGDGGFGALLELVVVGALEQVVDAALAKEVRLHLVRGTAHALGRARVKELNAVKHLLPASRLLDLSQFLHLALLLALLEQHIGAFPLLERLALLLPDLFLVAQELRVPRLFEVEILRGC